LEEYKGQEVADYLKSYIKKVENTMLSITLITENPEVYQVRKGIVTKTVFIFLVLLMIIIFVSFLLEYLESSSMRQQTEQNK